MILRKSDIENMYYANDVENSMFYLNKNDVITSMSDELVCARYDGLSQNLLINDLQKTDYIKNLLSKW